MIEKALDEVDELIVGIGSSQYGYTKENPFTLEERIEMIEGSVRGNYQIVPIPDINDFPGWVKHVEKLCPRFDVAYAGNETVTKLLFEQSGYEVRSWERKTEDISGTQVRTAIAKDEEWVSMVPESTVKVIEKKHGVERMKHIFENYKYKTPIPTVDGIVNYNGGYVLIKRKIAPFKGMFACPGGHVDWGETLKTAVVREIKEETGLDFHIEGYLNHYDKMGRDPRGHYITHVFYGTATGELKAGDDAAEVSIVKEIPEKLAFDHHKFFEDYEKVINSNIGFVRGIKHD
jgi:nicotinamide-nucleotide adenylyltransferase